MLTLPILIADITLAQRPEVTGDYVEARSSHVYTCGCLFSGEEVTSGRQAILSWRIHEGIWNGVPLNNLSVVAVLSGEENLGMPGDISRRSTLYLDANASDREANALLDLFRSRFSRLLGNTVAVHTVPIMWEFPEENPWIVIPGKLEVAVRPARPEDAHPGSRLWYEPFVSLSESTLATTMAYSYQDTDLDLRWEDFENRIAGYFGRFTFPSVQ